MVQKVEPGGIVGNLAPYAFHRWAKDLYECNKHFKSPEKFSPIPYFLLCRAIELAIKAKHLTRMTQPQVKKKFRHDIMEAYKALDAKDRILTRPEIAVLGSANQIYGPKGFEYFDAEDALTGYSRYPDLEILDEIAKKLLEQSAQKS